MKVNFFLFSAQSLCPGNFSILAMPLNSHSSLTYGYIYEGSYVLLYHMQLQDHCQSHCHFSQRSYHKVAYFPHTLHEGNTSSHSTVKILQPYYAAFGSKPLLFPDPILAPVCVLSSRNLSRGNMSKLGIRKITGFLHRRFSAM